MKNTKALFKNIISVILFISGLIVVTQLNSNSVKAESTSITLPSGYTTKRIAQVDNNKISAKNKKALINASIKGMKQNQFVGDDADKNVMVDVTKLSYNQKLEINRFALRLINSARKQAHKKPWTLNKSAMDFADRVAKQYHDNGRSVWDPDHYVAGITRAAVASGLKNAGQVYEDESGLPITSEFNGSTRSMYALKRQVYFNIKQMLFGGYYGTEDKADNAAYYTEWEHAGDLLGCRSLKGYDAPTKYFGLSFSDLPNDHSKISVHFMGVAKRYIKNTKKFNIHANL